jgi:DoxX-like family
MLSAMKRDTRSGSCTGKWASWQSRPLSTLVNTLVWFLQGLLAFAFLSAGALKVVRPKEQITAHPQMRWAVRLSATRIKLLGAAEVVGALALVEPWATGIVPVLTPLAAASLVVLLLGHAYTRARRKESPTLSIALALMAAIVAFARFSGLGQGGGAARL